MVKVYSRVFARVHLGVLALALGAVACSSGDQTQTNSGDTNPTSGSRTLLVSFPRTTTDAAIEQVLARHQGVLVTRGEFTGAALVRFPDDASAVRAAAQLRHEVLVTGVQQNGTCTGAGVGPSPLLDPALVRRQWNIPAMQLPALWWPFVHTAPSVTVAVLDTGIAYENFERYRLAPVLSGVRFAPGYDFVNDDGHANDDHQHGTHVASVLAAASQFRSVALGVRLMPVKVLDSANRGSELTLAEGIFYATLNGAKVINMSLAFPPGYIPGPVLNEAVDFAASRGVVLVAAAGNHAEDVVTYPAAFREVIAVGASKLHSGKHLSHHLWWNAEKHLDLADYSNHGARLDVIAPGGMVDEDLDGDGQPEAILGQSFELNQPDRFAYFSAAGTSQAAAEVSGLAAVLLDDNPQLDPYTLRAILGEGADLPGGSNLGPLDPTLGRGYVKFSHSVLNNLWQRVTHHKRSIFFANVAVTLHNGATGLRARATVEVVDQERRPAQRVRVSGSFVGGGIAPVAADTNNSGIVIFEVALPATTHITAFQVDAVSTRHGSRYGETVDRPRGFVRIGGGSLDLLSQFGRALLASGAGVGPSPLIVSYSPAGINDPTYRPTLNLLNWSWSLATVPIAVAADEVWYTQLFPDSTLRRAISHTFGVGPSPLRFTSASFPIALSTTLDDRMTFFLATYVSGDDANPLHDIQQLLGVGPSPLIPDIFNGGSSDRNESIVRVTSAFWASAMGVGPSPLFDPNLFKGLTVAEFQQIGAVTRSYAPFGLSEIARPVMELPEVLMAAGVTLTPPAATITGLGNGIFRVTP